MEKEASVDYSFKYRERIMVTGREGAFSLRRVPENIAFDIMNNVDI